jgi:hypothetical protein
MDRIGQWSAGLRASIIKRTNVSFGIMWKRANRRIWRGSRLMSFSPVASLDSSGVEGQNSLANCLQLEQMDSLRVAVMERP